MPRTLSPIFIGNPITSEHGGATLLLILRWQELIAGYQLAPTVGSLDKTAQAAALPTTDVFITVSGGQYRVNYALTRTIADGVSSSATVTIGWVEQGVARSETEAALTEAGGLSTQGLSRPIYADANTAITIAVAYASNTAGKMHFDLHANVDQMA